MKRCPYVCNLTFCHCEDGICIERQILENRLKPKINIDDVLGFVEWCITEEYIYQQYHNNPNGGFGVWYLIEDYENTKPITTKELFDIYSDLHIKLKK